MLKLDCYLNYNFDILFINRIESRNFNKDETFHLLDLLGSIFLNKNNFKECQVIVNSWSRDLNVFLIICLYICFYTYLLA